MVHTCILCAHVTHATGYCGACSDDLREWDKDEGLRKINVRRDRMDLRPLRMQDIREQVRDSAQAEDWTRA